MVSRGLKRIWKSGEDTGAVVGEHRDLAMHASWRAHDSGAKRSTNCLMTKAHAQNRYDSGEPPYERNGDTGFARRTRPWGNDDAVKLRGKLLYLVDGDHIVAAHEHLGPKLAQRLIEIEGERVIVVE